LPISAGGYQMKSNEKGKQKTGNRSRPDNDIEPTEKPALVINIQSWATPIVGLLMLIIGLSAGYYGRPFFSGNPAESPAQVAGPPETNPSSEPTVSSGDRESLMDKIVSKTRHFKGDPDAPVTIIEFSDFQ